MASPETPDAITMLVDLVQEWVDVAFPIPGNRDVPGLNGIWTRLAEALCGIQTNEGMTFQKEIARLRHTESAGAPPRETLEICLRKLVGYGIRDLFLVIAVRLALDDLIARSFPAQQRLWLTLADARLPRVLQFAYRGEELRGPHTILRSGS